eukprot:TRINITY_DN14401_c0_g1_i1.p1 TRINITY_DN14401_c0_g1~~TRINITY_DN14401_c0_g1_i1.p1  ORF type:complete len:176 (-),score=61.35 TRINITY_DN14401_c0_g1_i1:37-564(-)
MASRNKKQYENEKQREMYEQLDNYRNEMFDKVTIRHIHESVESQFSFDQNFAFGQMTTSDMMELDGQLLDPYKQQRLVDSGEYVYINYGTQIWPVDKETGAPLKGHSYDPHRYHSYAHGAPLWETLDVKRFRKSENFEILKKIHNDEGKFVSDRVYDYCFDTLEMYQKRDKNRYN